MHEDRETAVLTYAKLFPLKLRNMNLAIVMLGRAGTLRTLHPGHFVLKDVVMFQLRPRVIYPPGIHIANVEARLTNTEGRWTVLWICSESI